MVNQGKYSPEVVLLDIIYKTYYKINQSVFDSSSLQRDVITLCASRKGGRALWESARCVAHD